MGTSNDMTKRRSGDASTSHKPANHTGTYWVGVVTASTVLGGNDTRRLLHAGPPFVSVQEIPVPVMNSLAMACLYEKWALDVEAARLMIAEGAVTLSPAQDFGVVVPLAGVVSASMRLAAVSDSAEGGVVKYVPLPEGIVHATLFGRLDPDWVSHRKWIDTRLAAWLEDLLIEPLALWPILSQALLEGDDGHSRTQAGLTRLDRELAARAKGPIPPDIREFIDACPTFALHIWMATAAVLLTANDGIGGSTTVRCAGGNGVRFGIQLSSMPGSWTAIESPNVSGSYEHSPALPAIGDSVVIDLVGLGGQALSSAPRVLDDLIEHLPIDALERRNKIMAHDHSGQRDRRESVDAALVVASGCAPMALLGVLDADGVAGRIGAGVAEIPVALFSNSINGTPSSE